MTASERTLAEQRKDIAAHIGEIQSLKLQLRNSTPTSAAAAAASSVSSTAQFAMYSSGPVAAQPQLQPQLHTEGTQGAAVAAGASAFASGRVRTGGPVL